ncbi:ethylene-responsive transcription factor ERF019-like [Rutidosis leptorrhynchoides]|uniref:ethylene-responsive transcription factor ERF019-like n=1 Tax=Rutidosis leptorrhynchoides TaxID=125765 RepID=UPI003A994862
MSTSSDEGTSRSANCTSQEKMYKGIRCRRWGKWVSEIRVPGSRDRLWLGTYSTPQGAAMAHDVALYCLRGDTSLHKLNFPSMLPPTARTDLSPRSVQKVASDAGMAMDAHLISSGEPTQNNDQYEGMNISVDDYF